MSEFAIAACGIDGCAIVTIKSSEKSNRSKSVEKDPLVQKVIKSKLKFIDSTRQIEIKSPSDSLNMAIIVYGNAEEREKIFATIKDEMRTYLLNVYTPIPLHILARSLSNTIKKFKFGSFPTSFDVEVVLASWTSDKGYELFSIDENGEYLKCFGCAIGYQKEFAKENLSKLNLQNSSVEQLLVNMTKIAMEIDDDASDIQMSRICSATNGKHQNCDQELATEIMEIAER